MPLKLTTTLSKIPLVPNPTNASLIEEFHQYMNARSLSENHQNNCLKVTIAFANFLGSDTTFYQLEKKQQVLSFLETKLKSLEADPEKKWITTWNHYLQRIKLFLRWLYNGRNTGKTDDISFADWKTPDFVKIREKRTKRLSPYSETEIWERDELLSIIKYESFRRNKAAIALMWDLDARNHEVTLLKIKHIRLKESYGEGEIPHEAKTGSGPILLTSSFPYVRDWLNEHPFKNSPEARIICNLYNGKPVGPEAIWTMMSQLRGRISRMLENGAITDKEERKKMEYLLRTKRWNPYCIRHSAITADSDFLPEYALKKKARWSMNSKQGARYIKRTIGDDLRREILLRNGIITQESTLLASKPSVLACPRCTIVNGFDGKYCLKCSYPLTPQAFEEIKSEEAAGLKAVEDKHKEEISAVREEMKQKFQQIIEKIDIARLQ